MAKRKARAPDDGVASMVAAAQIAAAHSRNAPGKDGLAWGLKLHRWVDPKNWPAELERVPEEHRAEAEDYLRGIAKRMRTLRGMNRK